MPMKKKSAVKKTTKKTAKKVTATLNKGKQTKDKPSKDTAKKLTGGKQLAKTAGAITKPFNSTETVRYLAAATDFPKKDIVKIVDALSELIEMHLHKNGPGECLLLGLAKLRVVHKPATKARQGINPFNGKPTTFAAKPARNVIKIKPLKKLKEMI